LTRIDNLKKALVNQNKPTNIAIFNQANIIYFANFSGAVALLITEQGENILYTSGVNHQQAKAEAQNVTVALLKRGESVAEKIAKQYPISKLGVDSLSIENYLTLAKTLGEKSKLDPINNTIKDLRKIKDTKEIELIGEACKLASIGMETAKENIGPGIKEKQVAAEVEYAMRKAGSDGLAFETIVASGYCCAYPHGTFMDRTIQEGDLVVVDLGAIWRFYRSDITRTFIAGKPSKKQIEMFETVKLAQKKAFEIIAPRVSAKEIDAAARQVIDDAGFGEFFVHNLGHGVGLEVHEAPILSPDSKDVIEEGEVLTVEPGIYIPTFGGIRIEDTIYIAKDVAKKLTSAPYTL
jgi:Xaa-Pro dipeptidase